MTQTEYEQKRRECWEEFKRTNLDGEVQWQPVSRYDVFCAAFDRAYALGKLQASCKQVEETITQEEIEKAAEKFADRIKIPPSTHGIMVPFINGLAHDAYLQGAQDFLGKQEKDAEETKAEGNVTISLHVAVIPRQEEFYMGVDASHEAYTIDIPKSMIPSDLLAVINGECKNKVVTNIAIMK